FEQRIEPQCACDHGEMDVARHERVGEAKPVRALESSSQPAEVLGTFFVVAQLPAAGDETREGGGGGARWGSFGQFHAGRVGPRVERLSKVTPSPSKHAESLDHGVDKGDTVPSQAATSLRRESACVSVAIRSACSASSFARGRLPAVHSAFASPNRVSI